MIFSRYLRRGISAVLLLSAVLLTGESLDLTPKQAPGFVRRDLAGREVQLKDYRGKVVLLNFWATWCASCRVELPRFEDWQRKHGALGLQVLAVSMDDNPAPVQITARKLHLGFPIVMGDAKLGSAYGGILGLPVTFLVDREGRVVGKFRGEADLHTMEGAIETVLREP